MKTRFFYDTYKRIKVSVTVYITCAEPVYRVWYPPIAQPVETIAYLAEVVGFASSLRISSSTSFICVERL